MANYTEGERVVIQDDIGKNWTRHGTILSEERGKDSYKVLLDDGREFIRHRKHIRQNCNTDKMTAQKLRQYMDKKEGQHRFADTQTLTQPSGQLAVGNPGTPGMTDEAIVTQACPIMTQGAACEQREKAARTGQTKAY